MAKETFIIYKSFYKPISCLSDKQLGRLFRAIFRYNLGEVVDVEEDIRMAFGFFKNQFDLDEAKYQAKIVRDVENGRKGGNPNLKQGQANQSYEGKMGKKRKITQENPGLTPLNPPQPINDNDNVNENDNVIKEKTTKKEKRTYVVFQRPTLEEINAYLEEKGYTHTDAEKFFDFYESKNWMVGKNKMKDWKASVRNWERTEKERCVKDKKADMSAGVILQDDRDKWKNEKKSW